MAIDRMVRADKLRLLYRQSFPAVFVSLVTAGLLAWALWEEVEKIKLGAWLMLLTMATAVRLGLFLSYFRNTPSNRALLRWEMPYFSTLMLSALIWGFGALALMPADSLLHQAVTLFILVGMGGGAVSAYSARRYMAASAMLAVILPSGVWLALQPDKIQSVMAIGVTLFVLASLRASRVIANALHQSFELSHELARAHGIADSLAKTDALTGINNRRAFIEAGHRLIGYCQRNERRVCALLIDLDHFKAINDAYGHAAGDRALRAVADMLATSFRQSDIVGRLGGEEFAALLPDTNLADGQAIAEKLRRTIEATPVDFAGEPLTLRVSIGVTSGHADLETLLAQADAAMYRAKKDGRNRVVCHGAAEERADGAPGFEPA